MAGSIGSILSIARSALVTNQAAISVVSQNVANASTEGYSRKRAELATGPSFMTPQGEIGMGVTLADVSRVRDSLLDISYRSELSDSSGSGRRADLLGQVENLFGEPSSTGLAAGIDAFWAAWGDLANNPADDTARTVVRERGRQIVSQFNRLDTGLSQIAGSAALRLTQETDQVNHLAAEVASLNGRIVADEATGQTSGDLRDQRDRAIDSLAALADVQVTERADGSVGLALGGISIIDGSGAIPIHVDSTGGVYSLVNARGTTLQPTNGTLQATMQVLNTDLPAMRSQLDTLARSLATSVNSVHETGVNSNGQTGIKFFDDFGDPTLIDAGTLKLSADIDADVRAISAGTGTVDPVTSLPVYLPGRNDVARGLALLRDDTTATALGGSTIAGFYSSIVSRNGSDVRAAQDSAVTHDALTAQLANRRESVSGVAIDEEMVSLIRFQNAYSAAARLVTAADEMLQTLVEMKR